ncbi:hypothetical protein ACFQW4_08090 [Pantoea sp. GCM10028869]|uniref:hypothetical protein n=1 Tax=Pantoea sp. GCM10028869 TaxID=3273417 RepID=UPI00361664F8
MDAVRLKAMCAFLFFFIMAIADFYFSFQSVTNYLILPPTVVYSWIGCFSFLFSITLISVSLAPGYVAIYGVGMPDIAMKYLGRVIVITFVFALVGAFIFSAWYKSELEDKGYKKCVGIPSGWMPGTAERYTLDESICKLSNEGNDVS